jgi:hypothetical protein
VRDRRNKSRRGSRSGSGAVAFIGTRLWSAAAQRPIDSAAILCAVAASLIIVVNAAFLQTGSHPAPFFANPVALPQTADNKPAAAPPPAQVLPPASAKPSDAVSPRSITIPRNTPTGSVRRNDPIGDLIGSGSSPAPTSRVAAVQRVLTEFAYGQIKPTGVVDEPTSAAIAKFESEHKMPVTGRLSDRLLTELAAMTGHPIQ